MDDEFWRWSLEAYQRPGVAAALLAMQDQLGCNVNIVLWACWCARRFEAMPQDAFREAIDTLDEWHQNATAPLRRVRRWMKNSEATGGVKVQSLRAAIKDAELECERVEQHRLAMAASAFARASELSAKSIAQRARANIESYAALCGANAKKAVDDLLPDATLDHILQDHLRVSTAKA